MRDYMVVTEIHKDNEIERWFYGTYDRDRANEVAVELGNNHPIYHNVIPTMSAPQLGVLNCPTIPNIIC